MRVLVTGAGGFIGGRLAAALGAEPGIDLVPTTRDGRGGTRRLDVLRPGDFAPALAGCDAVVHCAAGSQAVIVDGTRSLIEAASHAGVRRIVHLSTISVYADASGEVLETAPLLDPASPGYGGWKSAAEQVCLSAQQPEIVRLRPTIVYGAGSRWWLEHFARRIRSGHWGTFGAGGEGICNPVHVDDVVGAIRAALDHPAAAGEAFNVNGPETLTWNAWFQRIAAAMGAPRLREISPAALRARALAALPLRAAARILPGFGQNWLLAMPGRSEVGMFRHRAIFPVDKAERVLGWAPRIGVDAGLAASLPWLRSLGLSGTQTGSTSERDILRSNGAVAAR